MEDRPGTIIKGKSCRRESTIDCRSWIEFEITEITMREIRFAYRVPEIIDTRQAKGVESGSGVEKPGISQGS